MDETEVFPAGDKAAGAPRAAELRAFLTDPANYLHPVHSVRHYETHISEVFLTGAFAFKIKKPVNLGFLDFSTIERRHYYCTREVSLNSRYASQLYLGVIPIRRNSDGRLSFCSGEDIVEYAVKMRQFEPESLFTELLRSGSLGGELLDRAVSRVCEFHTRLEPSPNDFPLFFPKLVRENHAVLGGAPLASPMAELLADIARLQIERLDRNKTLLAERSPTHVKLIHGDLHLGNICVLDGEPLLFDGIEFDDRVATVDVLMDPSFLVMDLLRHKRLDLAFRALTTYLAYTNDFSGLPLVPLYLSHLALVRAKVAMFALESAGEARREKDSDLTAYLETAAEPLRWSKACVVAVGGYSGSGKSVLAHALAESLGGIVIRSDAVRKHLAGVSLHTRLAAERYTEETTSDVYRAMEKYLLAALELGRPVILDATFLRPVSRVAVENSARDCGVSFHGLWCEVSPDTARRRVRERKPDPSDATVSVLENQLRQGAGDLTWAIIDAESSPASVLDRAQARLPDTATAPLDQ